MGIILLNLHVSLCTIFYIYNIHLFLCLLAASKTGHLDDLQSTDGRLGRLSQAGSRPTSTAAAGPRPESTTHGGTDRDAEHGQTPVQA